MTDTAEHECRRAGKCAARVRGDDGTMHGHGVERAGTLCKPCEQHAFTAIAALADDWSALAKLMTAGAPRSSVPRYGGTGDRPIPIPLGVDALMNQIETETLRWARIVAPDATIPSPSRECVRRCVAILGSRTGTLVDLPAREIVEWVPHPDGGDDTTTTKRDGVDAVLYLARLHQRAEAVTGTAGTRIWLPDPCPRCGRKALSPSKDQERVSCQACRQVWAANQFVFLGTVLDYERRTLKGESA